MRKFIEPFVVAPIASQQIEDETTSYFDEAGQLLAEANTHDGQLYLAVFYGTNEQPPITKQELEAIIKQVQHVFELERLVVESMEQEDGGWAVSLKMQEPKFNVLVPSSGMTITISDTGFVKAVTVSDNDFEILYPDKLISKEEARAILQRQSLLQLGIIPELGWQYGYKQNHDLYGLSADGTPRLWSNEDFMQGVTYEALPEVEELASFEAFLQGGRAEPVRFEQLEHEQYWVIPSDERICLDEDGFMRACRVVKSLVGQHYDSYLIEHVPALERQDHTHKAYRFIYQFEGISFEFQAISITVRSDTNQIMSISYTPMPFDTFLNLQPPTISLEDANQIAQHLVDVELYLENDVENRKKLSFVYLITYPTSPTCGHIQYVEGFTGEIHWVETGW